MLSQEQERNIQQAKRRLAQLKADFKAWSHIPWLHTSTKDPALQDLLKQLDTWHADAKSRADTEIDNPARAVALLQSANAYLRVKEYIQRQLSE